MYFDMMRIQSDCYEARPTRLNPNTVQLNEASLSDLMTFPNPCGDELNIRSKAYLCAYEIFGSNGLLLESGSLSGTEAMLNTRRFSEGMYYLKVYTSIGQTTRKIVK